MFLTGRESPDGSVPALDEGAVADLFGRVEEVSQAVVSTGAPETITAPGVTVVVYRAGDRPQGTVGRVPS